MRQSAADLEAARPPAGALAPDGPEPHRAVLIALISGRAPELAVVLTEAQSAALAEALLGAWQILPAIAPETLAALEPLVAPAEAARIRRAWLAVTAFARTQIVAQAPLLRALEASGLRYALLKGSALARLAYPQPYMRGAWDLDLAVHSGDLRRIEALARSCGFVAAQQDPKTGEFVLADPLLKAKVEAEHYELGFLVRRLAVGNLDAATRDAIKAEPFARRYWFDVDGPVPCCYASIDVHHALSHDIPVDDLLAGARRTAAGDAQISLPEPAWLLAHLVFKIYWEGVHDYGKGLYQYADLVRLIPHLDAAAFRRAETLFERHNLNAAAYFVLRRLPLFGIAPAGFIEHFIARNRVPPAGAEPIGLNDLGDMWPKLWGHR